MPMRAHRESDGSFYVRIPKWAVTLLVTAVLNGGYATYRATKSDDRAGAVENAAGAGAQALLETFRQRDRERDLEVLMVVSSVNAIIVRQQEVSAACAKALPEQDAERLRAGTHPRQVTLPVKSALPVTPEDAVRATQDPPQPP